MHIRAFALLALGVTAALTVPAGDANSDDGFRVLLAVEGGGEPWSGVLTPRQGPPRGGRRTVALHWPVDRRPGPNSPALLMGWQDVEAVRFWLHVDKPRPYRCNVLLTGVREYFNTAVALDFSGWRQFAIPVSRFGAVRGAVLEDMRRLSFRMQGYGQPELDKGMTWWVDHIEVKAKPGATLVMTNDLDANRRAWEKLAAEGNPFLVLNARDHARETAAFKPPETITSAWRYRGIAERLVPLAYAASAADSPHKGRRDLVDHALATVDWLTAECSESGWWFRKRPPEGDPNVNRFTLGPLLDAARMLRALPGGQEAWDRWRKPLDRAVALQRRAYHGQEDWDWGGRAGGEYANQDLYYVLIMALSAELFDRPDDRAEAETMMKRVADNLLPDGGIHYIGVTNEAPVYHALNLVLLGRYLTLTGNPVARETLERTANYWPLVLTAEGQPEYWSDVWWKQSWGYVWRESLVIAAGATGDDRNQWLMWRVLERGTPTSGGWGGICCAPYWTGPQPGTPLPERFVVPDGNMRGIRGRAGQWYFGVAQGRGLRNTFVGGLVTTPKAARPLLAAFRGAQIDVLPKTVPWRGYGLWLSEIKDAAGLALCPGASCAIGVRYTLQRGLINGWPTPSTERSPWQVTQVWRAAADGHIGRVELVARDGAAGATVAGRIALGPPDPERLDDTTWASGPIRVKLFESFGKIGEGPMPHYTQRPERTWHGVTMSQSLPDPVSPGTRFVYCVWIGPEWAEPPETVVPLVGATGWLATWSGGRVAGVAFNPGEARQTFTLPAAIDRAEHAWTGSNASPIALSRTEGGLRLELAPRQCVLVGDNPGTPK